MILPKKFSLRFHIFVKKCPMTATKRGAGMSG